MAGTPKPPGRTRSNGMGGLVRKAGSPNWYGLWYENGRKRSASLHTTSEQIANRRLQEILGNVAIGQQPPPALRKLRYEQLRQGLLDDYAVKGARSLKTRSDGTETIDGLKHLDDFFKGYSIAAITTQAVRKFVRKRKEQCAEPATINRNLALLRRMFSLARQEGKLATTPYFARLREAKPRQGFLDHATFLKLRAELPERVRPLVTFLYCTGCRLGAALKLEWSQLDLHGGLARLHGEQTKNAEPITLPLPEELLKMLRDAKRTSERVFDVGSFRTAWENACARLKLGRIIDLGEHGRGYEGLLVHDFRRSAVRNMVRSGVPETVAMKISGHKTRHIFDRYNITDTADIQEAMRKIDNSLRAAKLGANLVQMKPKETPGAA